MNARRYIRAAACVFALVAAAHLIRAATGCSVRIGTVAIPVWLSWLGAAGAGFLSAWGFRSARSA